MSLFQLGEFKLHSGEVSPFKIECDALTDDDWDTLGYLAAQKAPKVRDVVGIPRGGLKFAEAIRRHVTIDPDTIYRIVVDDVLTTGNSFEPYKDLRTFGIVAFARAQPAPWIFPIFQLK